MPCARRPRSSATPSGSKQIRGGYDGRGQARLVDTSDVESVDGRIGWPALLEKDLAFEAEVSVVVARNVDGISRTFPVARNRHDRGILVESVVPAGVPAEVEQAAADLAVSLATSMGLIGTLTVELFLMPDGSLVVNELAPRVHNSGHWTIEGSVTSQFEQHLRAICGLPLGSVAMRAPAAAMVNLLGEGAPRPAHPTGIYQALLGSRHARPHLRQGDRVRAAEDGPRDGARRVSGRGARPGARSRRAHRLGARAGGLADRARRARMTEPLVGVVGGSRSDFPVLEKAVEVLEELGVPSELRVVSAHRTPDHLYRYAESAPGRGLRVIIAGAGGAAHLPGMLAAKTILPVIGVPMPTKALDGLDSLLSIVQMPRGIPVATVAIGNAENAALLAVEILALSDPDLAARLQRWRADQTRTVMDDPTNASPL